jgi:GNAT superfamily N-acetyltransferase
MINIRPFDKEKDYPAITALVHTFWPNYAPTEEEFRRRDNVHPAHTHWGHLVAEKAGEVVGVATYMQLIDHYHPQRFFIRVNVYADHQRQGIGTALYHTLLGTLAGYNIAEINTNAREDADAQMQFWQKMGFVETLREWESRLEIASFDPQVLQGAADKVSALGIAIYSYADLAHDPEREQKLYELDCSAARDIPSASPFTAPSLEEYKKQYLQDDDPHFLPDAWFIAVENKSGSYVGVSVLGKPVVGDHLNTGLTGVLSEYRGRGIASALKLRAALYAKERNISGIRTWNAQNNKEMLAINEKMGFVKQVARVNFKKEIK